MDSYPPDIIAYLDQRKAGYDETINALITEAQRFRDLGYSETDLWSAACHVWEGRIGHLTQTTLIELLGYLSTRIAWEATDDTRGAPSGPG